MAQIMYGLALRSVFIPNTCLNPFLYAQDFPSHPQQTTDRRNRHGWGIPIDPPLAITYLSRAASNSAAVESVALSSGMKKGGAAKGELVLAIYELANSFRHGWGVEKDPVAARSYYETAANLGDTDAMNEVARCYEEGFGGKKDRVSCDISLLLHYPPPPCASMGRVGNKRSKQKSIPFPYPSLTPFATQNSSQPRNTIVSPSKTATRR